MKTTNQPHPYDGMEMMIMMMMMTVVVWLWRGDEWVFWNTATSKTVNSVKQIHAIVDGKAVVITESSVKNDLLFDDEDDLGADEFPMKEGGMDTANKPTTPEGHTSRSREGKMEHTFELMDIVPPTPHDSPLPGGYTPRSDEGRLKLEELIAMCTKLSKQVESSDDDLDEEDASKQGEK
ncbi:hypothetical protein Tco_0110593 [Tanacetum coccineum]